MGKGQNNTIYARMVNLLRSQSIVNLIVYWSKKLGGAVFDQIFFAGSNFTINVLLARWMSTQEYGLFVVIYSWFILIQNIYEATIVEPMNIFGAGKYFKYFRKYLGYLYIGHALYTSLLGLVVAFIGIFVLFYSSTQNALIVFAMSVCIPFLLTRWLTRQPFYVLSKPHLAAIGGFIYFVISVLIIILLNMNSYLNGITALAAMSIGGFIASITLSVFFLMPDFRFKQTEGEISGNQVLVDHWQYGRWSVMTRIMYWAQIYINYIILPIILSVTLSAALRATMNLIEPMYMAVTATISIILPYFVRSYQSGGRSSLNQRLRTVLVLYTAITIIFSIAIIVAGGSVIHFIYDGKFDQYVSPLYVILIALVPVLGAFNASINAALLAIGGVKQSFFARIIPTVLALTVGIWLLWQFNLVGAAISTLFLELATLILLSYQYIQFDDKEKIV